MLGVIYELRKHGYESSGFNCVFSGNVPIGAGMSSSAALFGLGLFKMDMPRIGQNVENHFVGV